MFKNGYYENLGYNLFYKSEDFRKKYASLATISQISLLLGLISNYRFSNGKKIEKVLEVGVYNGVTSLYMLRTGCQNSENYKQYGIDIDPSDFCGDAVIQEANERELKAFSLHRGKTVLNISEILDKNVKLDLVFLDGGHSHPFPLINLVSVIPYLHEESLICLHDVAEYMQPNDWGESFIYEIWPSIKYRNTDQMGNKETLGVVQLPKRKDELYEMLLKIAKTPLRASQHKLNGTYLGVDETTFIKLKSFMLKHFEQTFVEKFIEHLNDNLKKYNDEYVLRIHETRFYKYLFDQIETLQKEVSILKSKVDKIDSTKNFLKFLQNNKNKKILLWGASLYLENLLKENNLLDFNIIGIVDTNARDRKQLEQYKLYTPSEIKTLEADMIISTVYNSNEKVYRQIKDFLISNQLNIELAPNLFQQ